VPSSPLISSPVSAIDAARYGLSQGTSYPLQGILHVPTRAPSPVAPPETVAPPRTETGEGTPVSLPLEEITQHLMGTYVDKIGYEYMHCPEKDERL
jgi:probable 2-oxoglutarate dehydrogenase E1 component DHKTD1